MKLERKKNAVRNVKVGLINKLVTIIFPFILRTAIIKTLGTEYLGLSSLFTSVLQVLSLSELGIGSAMVFSLYQPIAEDDKKRVSELVELYKIVYRIIGSIIFIGGLLVLPFLPHLINSGCPSDINLYALYLLYLFNSSESYFIAAYKSTLLSAHQRRDVISAIGLLTHGILYIIQIFCLFFFKNYYMYVIWLPIFTGFENFITACYVNKHYSDCVMHARYKKSDLKDLLVKVRDLFGHKLSQVVTNSVDTIVISAFLGLQMVTMYNNYFYIMSAVSGILDIFYQAVLAGIGNSIFSEKKEKNENDFTKFTVMNSWLVGWCSICFLCLYQPAMRIWMGSELMFDPDTVVLFAVYFYVWKIRHNILVYKDAVGMWDIDRTKPYIEIVANLAINIVLVQIIGINGILISTIVSMLFVSIPWETKVFIDRFYKGGLNVYVILVLRYFLFTVIAGITTYIICNFISMGGFIGFALKLLICIVIPNIIILLLGLNNETHCKVVSMVTKVFESYLPKKRER